MCANTLRTSNSENVKMDGLIICSLDGGMLLFSEAYNANFGLGKAGTDSMQLASTLFALQQMASNTETGFESLKSVRQVI